MVGGRDYGASQYNRAAQARRSIGSLAKPIVALAALENGWRETSPIEDAPLAIGDYRPRNFDGKFHGVMPVSRAIATSCNTCAVRLQEAVGRKPVAGLASRLLDTEVQPDVTFALGTTDASPLQMASVYGTFANGGYRVRPYGVVALRSPEGATLEWRSRPQPDRIATPTAISALNRMLRGVLEAGGTASAAAIAGQDAAGKTGTTQDHADAWFVGYTRHLATAVWVGNDDPSRKTGGLTGGVAAGEIWAPMMRSAHSHLEHAREPLP
jgi:penicillin-binding protein 1A